MAGNLRRTSCCTQLADIFHLCSIFLQIMDQYTFLHIEKISASLYLLRPCGEVPERLNGTVSKTVVGVTPPRVRIPASPPNQDSEKSNKDHKTRTHP